MPLRADITPDLAEVFTDLADEFEGGITVKLLKNSNVYREYDTLLVLSTGVFFEYSEFRKKVAVQIARDDDELTSVMAIATHIELAGSVWEINAADTKAPSMADVTWKVSASLFPATSNFRPL